MNEDHGFFSAADDLRLYWESTTVPSPKAQIAVLHGFGDHLGRYAGIRRALAERGCSVHLFDSRGHGRSDGRRGYCSSFEDYLADVDLFWNRVRKSGPAPLFLIAHSHGALVGIRWLQTRRPQGLSGAVLSSPYLKLHRPAPRLKVYVGRVVGAVIPWLPVDTGLKSEQLSSDPAWQKQTDADPHYSRVATPRWFDESNAAQQAAIAKAKDVDTPSLVLCGSDDSVVSVPAIRLFFEGLGSSDKRLIEYPSMRHEVFNEIGKEQVWKDVSDWISAHL